MPKSVRFVILHSEHPNEGTDKVAECIERMFPKRKSLKDVEIIDVRELGDFSYTAIFMETIAELNFLAPLLKDTEKNLEGVPDKEKLMLGLVRSFLRDRYKEVAPQLPKVLKTDLLDRIRNVRWPHYIEQVRSFILWYVIYKNYLVLYEKMKELSNKYHNIIFSLHSTSVKKGLERELCVEINDNGYFLDKGDKRRVMTAYKRVNPLKRGEFEISMDIDHYLACETYPNNQFVVELPLPVCKDEELTRLDSVCHKTAAHERQRADESNAHYDELCEYSAELFLNFLEELQKRYK